MTRTNNFQPMIEKNGRADNATIEGHTAMNTNIPLLLEKIVEVIPYGLPKEEERKAFSDAVNVAAEGKDLSLAHWAFLGSELRALPNQQNHIQVVIDTVILGMDLRAAGKEWHEAGAVAYDANKAARSADKAAAYTSNAVSYAIKAAARAAESAAGDAAGVVKAAAAAAVDAAEAAVAAVTHYAAADYCAYYCASYVDGYAAAEAAARQRQRDALLEIIENAPIAKEVEK